MAKIDYQQQCANYELLFEEQNKMIEELHAENKRLLQTACLHLGEAKRVSRMAGLLEEELAKAKEEIETKNRELRNLKKWMEIKGIRKNI